MLYAILEYWMENILPKFTKPEVSLQCSQYSNTASYPGPIEFSPLQCTSHLPIRAACLTHLPYNKVGLGLDVNLVTSVYVEWSVVPTLQ